MRRPQILVDTNVILDVLLKREPWCHPGARIWAASEEGEIRAFLTANSLTDIHYVARRLTDQHRAREAVYLCLQAYQIVSVTREVLERALSLSGDDFEDDVQIAAVEAQKLDGIVTRDSEGFKNSTCPVWTPVDFVDHLSSAG